MFCFFVGRDDTRQYKTTNGKTRFSFLKNTDV